MFYLTLTLITNNSETKILSYTLSIILKLWFKYSSDKTKLRQQYMLINGTTINKSRTVNEPFLCTMIKKLFISWNNPE